MMLKPIKDRVVIKPDAKEDKVVGNIIVEQAKNMPEPDTGIITAIGGDVKELKDGDRVIYNSKWNQIFKNEGVDYVILNEGDIIGVLDA